MSTEVLQTEQLYGNYHLGKVSDVIKTYRIYGQSTGFKRVTLRVKRDATMCTEAFWDHSAGDTVPLRSLWLRSKLSSKPRQPARLGQKRGLLHQSEQLGIPFVPFGGATVPNFRMDAPPNGIWALDGRLTQEKA
ncbi:uncharacterized protein B0H18DRAFT_960973 [Fomitopsis serialis]|uniref:uncharacterized protein n=1 Tax=Fomitopsis serialis TaxID=139415 RepID=UPI002007529B|nr:uncharacterized protein B0H18DRAFT_960973 [Neoantrodia serialis]KAH9912547.1 hypothetical protein B0H18DRAFT_960973 [Neoantrodia serialis]